MIDLHLLGNLRLGYPCDGEQENPTLLDQALRAGCASHDALEDVELQGLICSAAA